MTRTISLQNAMAYTHIGNEPRWTPSTPPEKRPTTYR